MLLGELPIRSGNVVFVLAQLKRTPTVSQHSSSQLLLPVPLSVCPSNCLTVPVSILSCSQVAFKVGKCFRQRRLKASERGQALCQQFAAQKKKGFIKPETQLEISQKKEKNAIIWPCIQNGQIFSLHNAADGTKNNKLYKLFYAANN